MNWYKLEDYSCPYCIVTEAEIAPPFLLTVLLIAYFKQGKPIDTRKCNKVTTFLFCYGFAYRHKGKIEK